MGEQNLSDGIGELGELALAGKALTIADPDPNAAAVLGKTAFSNNQPTFVIQSKPLGDNKKRKTLGYISLEQKSPAAGGPIEVLVFIATNLVKTSFSGHNGNQIANLNPFLLTGEESIDCDFFVNPVLDVAAAGLTLVDRKTFIASVGSTIEVNPPETVSIPAGQGSILVWVISATTGLSFKHRLEVYQT